MNLTKPTKKELHKARKSFASVKLTNGKAVAFNDYYDCELDVGEMTFYDEAGKELTQILYSERLISPEVESARKFLIPVERLQLA